MYIVIYKKIACKSESQHYENILWCQLIYVIYSNAVMPIALCKLHNSTEYYFWYLMDLTHTIVGYALDNVWYM